MTYTPRPYLPSELAIWKPFLADLIVAAPLGRDVFYRLVARNAGQCICAVAIACDTTPDVIDALPPDEVFDLLRQVVELNQPGLIAALQEGTHGPR